MPHVPAGGKAQQHEHGVLAEHAKHEDFGVREVDQAKNAVDQGVTDGHQRVDRAVGEAVDGQLPKIRAQRVDVEIDRTRSDEWRHLQRPGTCHRAPLPERSVQPGAVISHHEPGADWTW
jgi:hypothetical protein